MQDVHQGLASGPGEALEFSCARGFDGLAKWVIGYAVLEEDRPDPLPPPSGGSRCSGAFEALTQ